MLKFNFAAKLTLNAFMSYFIIEIYIYVRCGTCSHESTIHEREALTSAGSNHLMKYGNDKVANIYYFYCTRVN